MLPKYYNDLYLSAGDTVEINLVTGTKTLKVISRSPDNTIDTRPVKKFVVDDWDELLTFYVDKDPAETFTVKAKAKNRGKNYRQIARREAAAILRSSLEAGLEYFGEIQIDSEEGRKIYDQILFLIVELSG